MLAPVERVCCVPAGVQGLARPTRETRQVRGAYHHGTTECGGQGSSETGIGVQGTAHEMGTYRDGEQVQ